MIDETTGPALPRQVAELILQDERLTSDLEDREADVLLRWTLAAGEDENVLIIHSRDIALQYLEEFQRVRRQAAEAGQS